MILHMKKTLLDYKQIILESRLWIWLLCMPNSIWWMQLKFKALWFSLCVCKWGIGGPPLPSLHTLFILLPVVCLISCRIRFLHFNYCRTSWIVWISFINSITSSVICCRNGLDYYLNIKLLYIAYLFNDEVLRTIIHCECFPVREINV